MKTIPHFILIDDEPIINVISTMIIEDVFEGADIRPFTNPEKGFEYLSSFEGHSAALSETILFLDINMPRMTGWQFMLQYIQLKERVKNKIKVFFLSSSIDRRDKIRALNTPNVIDYLEKPLTPEKLVAIVLSSVSVKNKLIV